MNKVSKSAHRRALCAAVAAAALWNAAEFARGIVITMSYDAANSSPPAADPGGTQLQAIMNYVRNVYNDIFEDAHNITITYRWGTPSSPGAIAAHSLSSQGGVPNRETAGTIVFRNTTGWFFDPTPADNSEFDMSQTLWRDLTATQRNNFYSNFGANIPSTFEAGFTGTNNGTNPNVAGNFDLLSTAFHEVGHALGMSSANNSTIAETADNDYDYNTAFVFGQTLAADVASGGNIAHLANSNALMFPSFSTGQRILPSHTDLFAMASGHQYLLLDIPRREFYGGTNWNAAGNWSGNQIPGSADEAFVRASGPNGEIRNAGLSANASVGTLNVAEGSNVETNAFQLTVVNALNLSGLDTDLFVEAGGTLSMFSSSVININDQAELSVLGGVVTGVGTINNNAEIIGRGTINFSGRLNNSGSINVSGGSLLINATGTGSVNLDGNSTGTILFNEPGQVFVTASGTSLTINGSLTDAFNGD
ncbi:MAG: hypothetical protein NZ561_05585, partial [Phycisphaerae bacterium]|nr:hypothetical protein [Phycisphaerae bacterium]